MEENKIETKQGDTGLVTAIKETICKPVKINGREFDIGKLDLAQVSRLTLLVGKALVKYSDQFKNIDTSGKTIMDDVMAIMTVFDLEQLTEFVSIAINCDDKEFCRKIPVEDVTEVIAEVFENNDIQKIVKNSKRMEVAIRKALTK